MTSDSDSVESPTRPDEPRFRLIVTPDAEWRVYEQVSPYDRRRGSDLVFESEGVIRRVRNYPPNWIELSDAALLAVSWGR